MRFLTNFLTSSNWNMRRVKHLSACANNFVFFACSNCLAAIVDLKSRFSCKEILINLSKTKLKLCQSIRETKRKYFQESYSNLDLMKPMIIRSTFIKSAKVVGKVTKCIPFIKQSRNCVVFHRKKSFEWSNHFDELGWYNSTPQN